MKKIFKMFGIIAFVAIIGFSFTACDDDDGGGNGGGDGDKSSTPAFDSIVDNVADFATWLAEQPDNTEKTAYRVKLNVSDLGGAYYTNGSAGKALYTNNEKYVALDLSDSTFTSIGNSAFSSCSSLTNVTISNIVTSIGSGAFSNCTSLTAINVNAANTAYSSQDGVLYNKDKTSLIAYPGGKTENTFTIPASVTSIGNAAFDNKNLTNVTIPNSVTSIGYSVFGDCTSLTAINVNAANTTYSSQDGILYNKAKTSLIAYPSGKTENTFTIPNDVTSIGNGAFNNCKNLTSLTIPASVTIIEHQPFFGCTSLTSVTFATGSNITSFGDRAFPEGYGSNTGNSLKTAYSTGKAGTYTRELYGSTWTKIEG